MKKNEQQIDTYQIEIRRNGEWMAEAGLTTGEIYQVLHRLGEAGAFWPQVIRWTQTAGHGETKQYLGRQKQRLRIYKEYNTVENFLNVLAG